jgi:hypothetical protein
MKGNNSRNVSLLLASLVIGIGMVTSATIATAAPYAGGWKDHKGWTFGPITSIQNDNSGKPSWVLSGHWVTNLINSTKDSFNQTNPAKFDVWINMVMVNGSAMHKHRISNFSLSNEQTDGKTATYQGKVTITMKDGPVANVPVEIKVMDNHVVTISLDSAMTKNHFGNTPIYGTVLDIKDMKHMSYSKEGKNMTMQ